MAVQDKLVNLEDLKTAYDATVHTGAQTLTPAQAAQARANVKAADEEEMVALMVPITPALDWAQGALSVTTGAYSASSTRIFCRNFLAPAQGGAVFLITPASGYGCSARVYSAANPGSFLESVSDSWDGGASRLTLAAGQYVRFVLRRVDDSAILPEEGTGVAITALASAPYEHVSPDTYFSSLIGGTGSTTYNGKQITAHGNHVTLTGTVESGNSTFATFNVAGTVGGIGGTATAANIKSLFTGGYCFQFPEGMALPDRLSFSVSWIKTTTRETLNNPLWGIAVYTYDADSDTLTAGFYSLSEDFANNVSAKTMGAISTELPASFTDALAANGNLAVIVYARAACQYAGNQIDLVWSLAPAATDTATTVSGTAPTITAAPGASYVCGTLDSLAFTPCASGLCSVRFTSGTTPTVLTGVDNVKWPSWFNPSALSTNTVYELSISDGVYGVVGTWAT